MTGSSDADMAPEVTIRLAELGTPEPIVLSPEDSRAFANALIEPPPVNARLIDTVRRYRAVTRS